MNFQKLISKIKTAFSKRDRARNKVLEYLGDAGHCSEEKQKEFLKEWSNANAITANQHKKIDKSLDELHNLLIDSHKFYISKKVDTVLGKGFIKNISKDPLGNDQYLICLDSKFDNYKDHLFYTHEISEIKPDIKKYLIIVDIRKCINAPPKDIKNGINYLTAEQIVDLHFNYDIEIIQPSYRKNDLIKTELRIEEKFHKDYK